MNFCYDWSWFAFAAAKIKSILGSRGILVPVLPPRSTIKLVVNGESFGTTTKYPMPPLGLVKPVLKSSQFWETMAEDDENHIPSPAGRECTIFIRKIWG